MGKPKYDWIEIKKAYECGKSVNELVDKYNVTKKTLQNKISAESWEVSGTIKADITHLRESVGKVSGTIGNHPDKAHIIAEDVIDCINQVADLVEAEKLVKSASLYNLARSVELLKHNTKLEKVNVGDGVQNFETVGLGSSDYKNLQDTIDKASITLGVNQRHANSQVAIQNNVQESQEEHITIKIKE